MLRGDLEVIGLSGAELATWLELLLPPGVHRHPESFLLVITDDGAVIHAVRGGTGIVDLAGATCANQAELAALRRRSGAGVALALDRESIGDVLAEVESQLTLRGHWVDQAVTAANVVRRANRQSVWLDPPLLSLIPPLRTQALERAFGLLVPDRSTLTAYVFEEDRRSIAASVIAVVERGEISLVTGHRYIEDVIGGQELAARFPQRYPRVNAALAERLLAPSISLFIGRAALHRIITGPSDQFARELQAKNAILDPAPAWLLGMLGGAAVAAVAGRSAKALAGLLPKRARKAAAGLAQTAQKRAKESPLSPLAALGFDPVELWKQLRRYYAA